MTDNVLDIQTRKPIERIETPEGEQVQQFMRRWAKALKDGRFKSVFILAIDENDFTDWGFLPDTPYHSALACLTLEDLRDEIKDDLIGYADFEDDEGEED